MIYKDMEHVRGVFFGFEAPLVISLVHFFRVQGGDLERSRNAGQGMSVPAYNGKGLMNFE